MKRLTEDFYPGLIIAIFIMVIMGLPGNYFPNVVSFWDWLGPDKVIHLIVFGMLSYSMLWGYRKKILSHDVRYIKKSFLLTLLLSVSYGALTELMQKYVFINRFGSIYDFIADAIGCVLGAIVFILYFKKKVKKNKNTANNI
ncbi:MAG: VanZ family protein [Bacteroidales bacterium]|nr:VanZ family protein [Bacteroidales bacterium]